MGAEFLKNLDIDIRSEIDELCSLDNPESFFKQNKNESKHFGHYSHGSYLRLIQLVKNPDLVERLPETSFKMGEIKTESSKAITYKILLVKLSYFTLYCLNHLKSDDKYFTDAVANPMKKLDYGDELDKKLITFYVIVSHASLLVCATKWIANFSEDKLPYQLRLIFIKPLLTYTSTILGYDSHDPILNWGIRSIRYICSESLIQTHQYLARDFSEPLIQNENHFNKNLFLKIANGDDKIRKRFGSKMYTEFEKEIAKIFDAFGFFVSPTKIGKRRADLIIVTQKPNAYTFLVDAKSCKGNYSLPTSDSRAIKEYIFSQKESLDIMPPLKFFLIISSMPSKTLESKLKKLSNDVGLPIKFVSALDLCGIIDSSNWSIYSQLFLKSIIESDPILDKDWGKKLVQSIKEKKNAFTKYTELLQ